MSSRFQDRAKLLLVPLAAILISYYYRAFINPPRKSLYKQGEMPHTGTRHPYIRSSLASHLYDRMLNNDYLRTLNKSLWYDVEMSKIPLKFQKTFLHLNLDEETANFIDLCYDTSDNILLQLWHNLARLFLRWWMTQTSINGLLFRGSMFVFSREQFNLLLNINPASDWKREALLDIGAGDGAVTEIFSPYFSQVYATETSGPMRWRLQNRGYNLLEIDNWGIPNKYDMISILNVLDRCSEPITMLKTARKALKPKGILLVASVLPFRPYVEFGGIKNKPVESVNIAGDCLETQIEEIDSELFAKTGFEIVTWSKVPYLCQGDLKQAFYWLTDAIFVLKPV